VLRDDARYKPDDIDRSAQSGAEDKVN
jgi:hypothetical protein